MTYVTGVLDEEQVDQLMDAEYVVDEAAGAPSDLEEGQLYVSVEVSDSVMDLLSPPMCPVCGEYMENHSEQAQGQFIHKSKWICLQCRTVAGHIVVENKKE